jgi:hypothetical protein
LVLVALVALVLTASTFSQEPMATTQFSLLSHLLAVEVEPLEVAYRVQTCLLGILEKLVVLVVARLPMPQTAHLVQLQAVAEHLGRALAVELLHHLAMVFQAQAAVALVELGSQQTHLAVN